MGESSLAVDRRDVFVVVPVFNEAKVLGGVLGELVALGYTVVPVDDGSSDDSWEVICGLPVHGLRHGLNLGQGAALETGMEYARRQGAAIAVHFDADGQHAAEQIDSLIEPLRKGEADVVLGSRFLRAADTARIPPRPASALAGRASRDRRTERCLAQRYAQRLSRLVTPSADEDPADRARLRPCVSNPG